MFYAPLKDYFIFTTPGNIMIGENRTVPGEKLRPSAAPGLFCCASGITD